MKGAPGTIVWRWLYINKETHEVIEFNVLKCFHCLALHEVRPVSNEEGLARKNYSCLPKEVLRKRTG